MSKELRYMFSNLCILQLNINIYCFTVIFLKGKMYSVFLIPASLHTFVKCTFEFSKKRNSIFILIFNKAAAINYFEHLFRSLLTWIQYNEFIYTPLLLFNAHHCIILLWMHTIYFSPSRYSINFSLFMSIFLQHYSLTYVQCLTHIYGMVQIVIGMVIAMEF